MFDQADRVFVRVQLMQGALRGPSITVAVERRKVLVLQRFPEQTKRGPLVGEMDAPDMGLARSVSN